MTNKLDNKAGGRIPEEALTGSLRDYKMPTGPDLLNRINGFYEWQDLRRSYDLWPYAKSTATAPKTHCSAKSDAGELIKGVNFASQDYLSLASHPAVKQAAMEAIKEYGVHSAGSAALLGNTRHSLLLEQRITEFLNGRQTVLYPTGWSAGFAAIQQDRLVVDGGLAAGSLMTTGRRRGL